MSLFIDIVLHLLVLGQIHLIICFIQVHIYSRFLFSQSQGHIALDLFEQSQIFVKLLLLQTF